VRSEPDPAQSRARVDDLIAGPPIASPPIGGPRSLLAAARRARTALAAAIVLAGAVPAQQKPPDAAKDGDDRPVAIRDPYTGGDPEVMARAGIVGYAPFPWADHVSTADIDRVLGERRILWAETAHFRFGLTLRSASWPEEPDQRKFLTEEFKALRRKLPKIPERPRTLDPWIRLHLYAQRAEAVYADFQKLLGVTDADFPGNGDAPPHGPYLGLPGKHLVLLFQKKADLARYLERFTTRKGDASERVYHDKTHQLLVAVAVEAFEGFDESGLHGHVLYGIVHNLLNGYNGYFYSLPLWLEEGVAHWYSRRVPSSFVNVQIRDDEAVAEFRQNDWPVKVRRRAQHVGAFFRFEQMVAWREFAEMGYHAHSQSWSRVDYLMHASPEKVGLMLRHLKGLAVPPGGLPAGEVDRLAAKLLEELFLLDGPKFDAQWRAWVLDTYPKK
jgi:hypothetical protein